MKVLVSSLFLGLVLSTPAATQSSSRVIPARVEPVVDFADFGAHALRADFESLPVGTLVGPATAALGVGFEFAGGAPGEIWLDGMPRTASAPSGHALNNFRSGTGGHFQLAPRGADDAGLLRLAFALPVTRIAFELRTVRDEHANLVLSALHAGRRVGACFFDLEAGFRVVGLESSLPFDEVRLAFTNPPHGAFSLDELWFETDLRDRDNDGVLDFVDLCPGRRDSLQLDGDGLGDACDPFPADAQNDLDGDGLGADIDDCPLSYDPLQGDADGDGIGDACDSCPLGIDSDGDGIPDGLDNCPNTANPDQADCDSDGVGDVCDTTLLEPQEVTFALRRGESVTLTKHVCIPRSPPKVDFVMAIDVTGSMGGEINQMQENFRFFARRVRELAPDSDIRFGLVSYADYPHFYSSCGYSQSYGGGIDYAFRVEAPVGASDAEVIAAINSVFTHDGFDGPESYSRVLWEFNQPDSGIGFRPGARRVVLNACDNIPHDCQVGAGLPGGCIIGTTGWDPGRDEHVLNADDIDFQDDALAPLVARDTRLFTIFSDAQTCAWTQWTESTGGQLVQASPSGILPPGTDLAAILLQGIADTVVEQVSFDPGNCALQITFDPPVVGPIDVTFGARIEVEETITVPLDLPGDVTSIDCGVRVIADRVLLGTQRVHVDIGCSTLTFDGLANGHGVSPADFAGQGVTISSTGANAGAALFDSQVGGPNDPGLDTDLLIGHGNLLLLQDDAHASLSGPGTFATPVDDPQGGDLAFDFAPPIDPRSVLLTDLDPPPNAGASVTLTDGAGRRRVYSVPPGWTGTYGVSGFRILDLSTLAAQPGAGARLATASEDPGFQQANVVRVVVHMTGLGAMDELVFCR